jgi:polar amino acid transport system ATP-binding protein
MAFIEVTGLSKSFGDHVVLRDVSFEIQRGQTVAVIGASGGGKSTMLRCLIGLETADAGTLSIDGQAFCTDGVYLAEKQRVQVLGKMGMVFQSFNLFPHLSVLDNLICAPLYVRGENRKSAVERAMAQLDNVGLSDKRDAYPSQLSGGQQQRVALA